MTITFKVSENTIKEMQEFLKDDIRVKTPPYAVFQADDADTVITVYESGKAVFQGKDADLSSNFWIEREKYLNPNKKLDVTNSDNKETKKDDIYIDPKIYNSSSIGSDEVGTGDYFGPIVVTASYVKKDDIPFLEELGVKDSKKLTDEKILNIVPQIIKRIPYESFILTNSEYNKYSDNYNMNKIKAILHNKVLLKMKNNGYKYDYIIVDEFSKKYVYFSYLKESSNVVTDITFLTKGESRHLAVAVSSLISRYIFIKEFSKLSNDLKVLLPKGASTSVDDTVVKIVNMYGFDKLKECAKLNFKNTEKIKEKLK